MTSMSASWFAAFKKNKSANIPFERVKDNLIAPWGDTLDMSSVAISATNILDISWILTNKGMIPSGAFGASKFYPDVVQEIISSYINQKLNVDGQLTWETFANDISGRRVLATAMTEYGKLNHLITIEINDDGKLISEQTNNVLASLAAALCWIPNAVKQRATI